MSFTRRVTYFLIGTLIGVIFVYFVFLRNRGYDGWIPSERLKTEFNERPILFDYNSECKLKCYGVTMDDIKAMISKGNIDFAESRVRQEPCKLYVIYSGDDKDNSYRMIFEKCDDNITLSELHKPDAAPCECD